MLPKRYQKTIAVEAAIVETEKRVKVNITNTDWNFDLLNIALIYQSREKLGDKGFIRVRATSKIPNVIISEAGVGVPRTVRSTYEMTLKFFTDDVNSKSEITIPCTKEDFDMFNANTLLKHYKLRFTAKISDEVEVVFDYPIRPLTLEEAIMEYEFKGEEPNVFNLIDILKEKFNIVISDYTPNKDEINKIYNQINHTQN